MQPPTEDQKTYVVLGVHRSGTSFLSRALVEMGVDMGVGSNPHSEDGRFVARNQAIIQGAGGTWKAPPAPGAVVAECDGHAEQIVALLQRPQPYWGWKDPRQALTIEGWVPYLKEAMDDVYLICIFRRPERVAASLRRLGQHADGYGLAQEYARRVMGGISAFMEL